MRDMFVYIENMFMQGHQEEEGRGKWEHPDPWIYRMQSPHGHDWGSI